MNRNSSADAGKTAVCICGHTELNHTERDGCLCHVNATGDAVVDHVSGSWCSCSRFVEAGTVDLEQFLIPTLTGAIQ